MRKALLAAVLMIAASGLWAQAQQTVIVTAPQVVVVNPASACPGGNCPQQYYSPRGGYSSSSWNIPGLGGVSRYQSQSRYQQSVNINGLFRSSINVTPRGVTQSFSIPGLINTRRAFR